MKKKSFFEKTVEYKLEGYLIPVRDPWTLLIEKTFLTTKEKDLYEKEFGETILNENEFKAWHKRIYIEDNNK